MFAGYASNSRMHRADVTQAPFPLRDGNLTLTLRNTRSYPRYMTRRAPKFSTLAIALAAMLALAESVFAMGPVAGMGGMGGMGGTAGGRRVSARTLGL